MEPVEQTSKCGEDPKLTPLTLAAPKVAAPARKKHNARAGRYKYLAIHMDELARQRARELADAPELGNAHGKDAAACRQK